MRVRVWIMIGLSLNFRRFLRPSWVLGSLLVLAACADGIRLSPTPTVFLNERTFPSDIVPEDQRRVDPTIFYVTDRAPVTRNGAVVDYLVERSDSMAFGATWVQFGQNLTWPQLVAASGGQTSGRLPGLSRRGLEEIVKFPSTPLPFELRNGSIQTLPEAQVAMDRAVAEFVGAMRPAIQASPTGDVLLYVHGIGNQFDDSVAVLANLWHFSGRDTVPLVFSWPAGNTGLFRYLRDRESGEFAIFHLKVMLQSLASIPELNKIHIISHSRGTDVVTSAIRELSIAQQAVGQKPREALKTGILVMAAPDLDLGVARQRLVAERFAAAFDQINVYINTSDSALRLAQNFATGTRFGRIRPEDVTDDVRESLTRAGNVHFISVEDAGGGIGHAYFRQNPGVVSDIVLTLRTKENPGGDARPLENVKGNFWNVHRNYPAPRATASLFPPDDDEDLNN